MTDPDDNWRHKADANPSNSPFLAELVVDLHEVEHFYKAMEEGMPCEPMSDAMLTSMNRSLGFKGDAAKDRDYRPYCVREGCKRMPRMFRVPQGFMCWYCTGIWDLSAANNDTKTL